MHILLCELEVKSHSEVIFFSLTKLYRYKCHVLLIFLEAIQASTTESVCAIDISVDIQHDTSETALIWQHHVFYTGCSKGTPFQGKAAPGVTPSLPRESFIPSLPRERRLTSFPRFQGKAAAE